MIYKKIKLEDALAGNEIVPDTGIGVYNSEGEIAMKHLRLAHALLNCGSVEYLFRTQANICLAWVKEENVDCILKKTGGCCGQKRPGVFVLANASDARRWTNQGGR